MKKILVQGFDTRYETRHTGWLKVCFRSHSNERGRDCEVSVVNDNSNWMAILCDSFGHTPRYVISFAMFYAMLLATYLLLIRLFASADPFYSAASVRTYRHQRNTRAFLPPGWVV